MARKTKRGVVVDPNDTEDVRRGMRKAGYPDRNPKGAKRKKPDGVVERIRKLFGGG